MIKIDITFFIIYFFTTLILFLVFVMVQSYKHKKIVMPKVTFSIKKYYVALITAPISVLIYAYMVRSWDPVLLFCVFCMAGIIGETAFSLWWHHFYGKRFWVYTTQTLLNKYTSSLNFLAWGLGGFMYVAILSHTTLMRYKEMPFFYILLFSIIALFQLIIFYGVIKRFIKTKKFHKVTFFNGLFFYSPILIALIISINKQGMSFLTLFILFGVIAGITEYVFGKVCEFILSKKLWKYVYFAKDKGHFTLLSVPAFSAAGIYFWLIFELVNIFL